MKSFFTALLLIKSITHCLADISCDTGSIRAKTYRWYSNITECIHPTSELEIVNIIENILNNASKINKTTIRAIGASISLNAVGMIDNFNVFNNEIYNDIIIINNTGSMNNIIDLDLEEGTLTLQSGFRKIDITNYLDAYNYTLPSTHGPGGGNMVGIFMTGTHSSGNPQNPAPILAGNVKGMRMVIGNGTVLVLNETYNTDIFHAALVSFGALGIVTEVTLHIIPKPKFSESSQLYFYNQTTTYIMNNTLQNTIFPLANQYNDTNCFWITLTKHFECGVVRNYDFDSQHNIICNNDDSNSFQCIQDTEIKIDNNEWDIAGDRRLNSEWFVSYDIWEYAWHDIIMLYFNQEIENTLLWQKTINWYNENSEEFNRFDTSRRFLKSNDIWLSPSNSYFYDENNNIINKNMTFVQVSIHHSEYLPWNIYEEWHQLIYKMLVNKYQPVRFHFGKIDFANYCELKAAYPKLDDFKKLRQKLDPYNLFLNQFTVDKLGLCNDDDHDDVSDIICCCTGYSCFKSNDDIKDDELDWELILIIVGSALALILLFILIIYVYKRRNKQNQPSVETQLSGLLK